MSQELSFKVRNGTEIGMYFEGKNKNMPLKDIELSILLLREIIKMGDQTK